MDREDSFLDAGKSGQVSVVRYLLSRRPELVSFADELGKTGLHWTAETDQAETARLLLDAGADIEARTSWGATPLDWAAVMGSKNVAELLLAGGAGGFKLTISAALGKLENVKAVV